MAELPLTDDMVLHYETWGDPEAPAVVLLHGFTGDLRNWIGQVEAFARDYYVVAPDLRGHGKSSAPEDLAGYSMATYAEDVRALLNSLEVELCALVGLSFGGMVALNFAVAWPERLAALVVSDASASRHHDRYAPEYHEREQRIEASEAIVERYGAGGLAKRAATGVADGFLAAGVAGRYRRMSSEGYLGAAKARRERPDLVAQLRPRLTMPVLLCAGELDPVKSAMDVVAGELPDARYLTFRQAGHPVPLHRPAAYTEAVLTFLGDVEEGRPIGRRELV